ncbi:MAG: CBS domain-containing protein [Actinomycetota bacterium]
MSSEAMTIRSLIRIRGSATLEDAARLMCDMSMGALRVDDADSCFVGLITERDLLWAMAQGKDPEGTPVGDVVNNFPIMVDGPISSEKAAERMMSAHVRHLLVREGDRLGVVSLRDVVRGSLVDTSSTCTHSASAAELRRMFGKAFI